MIEVMLVDVPQLIAGVNWTLHLDREAWDRHLAEASDGEVRRRGVVPIAGEDGMECIRVVCRTQPDDEERMRVTVMTRGW